MTSTNINIGIEGRSSSRILKPPGGAHTDIFGATREQTEISTGRFSKQSQKSSISECFSYSSSPQNKQEPIKENTIEIIKETVKPIKENFEIIKETVKEEVVSGNGLKNGACTEDENTKPTADVTSSAPQRVRVPPGGFSSGLW